MKTLSNTKTNPTPATPTVKTSILNHVLRFAVLLLMTGMMQGMAQSDISFSLAPIQTGIDFVGPTYGASWGELNGDGYPDLYVSGHFFPPSGYYPIMYVSNGDGTFHAEYPDVGIQKDGHGGAWADFDNDGDQDLLALTGGKNGNLLYINTGGALTDEADARGLNFDPIGRGRTPLWMDVDNDGLLDVMATMATPNRPGQLPTQVYMQQAGGLFAIDPAYDPATFESTPFAQLIELGSTGPAEILLNIKEGLRALQISEGGLQKLYEMAAEHTVMDIVKGDFNGDLRPDFLMVQHDKGKSTMYQPEPSELRNYLTPPAGVEHRVSFQGGGTLSFWSYIHGEAPGEGMIVGAARLLSLSPKTYYTLSPQDPLTWGLPAHTPGVDEGVFIGYDTAGATWHIAYTAMSDELVYIEINGESSLYQVVAHGFDPLPTPVKDHYMQSTPTAWKPATYAAGLDGITHSYAGACGDFDNDGDLDIYLVSRSNVGNAPNLLYENQGNGSFVRVPNAGGAKGSTDGNGENVAVADYDRDGFLDLLVCNGQEFWFGPLQLFRNDGNANHWLEIDLEGTSSNRDGIGASVDLWAGGRQQRRLRDGGMHRFSQNHMRLHFGLGAADLADSLKITWPSGTVQMLYGVAADQIMHIVESPPVRMSASTPRPATMRVFPNPARDKVTIALEGLREREFDLSIYTADGRLVDAGCYQMESGPAAEFILSVEQLPAGSYLLRLVSAEGESLSTRLVLVH